MTRFSENDEEKLINIVAGHPVIYDTSNPNYRNNFLKVNVWEGIGKELNKNSDDCKKKWKFIRDGYHRFRKKHQLGTGSAPKHSKDKRHLLLSFLDCDPQHRYGGSNVPSSPSVLEGNEEDGVDDPLSSHEQVSEDGVTGYAEEDSDNDDLTEAEVANEQKRNLDANKKGLKEDLKDSKDRYQKRQSLIKPIMKRKDDDIELFVRHIGEVLRNLPQLEKAQAKKNLYAVLSDYEIMAAQKLSSSSSSPNSPEFRASDQSRPRRCKCRGGATVDATRAKRRGKPQSGTADE